MEIIREVAKVGNVEITLETGKLAKQANSVVMSCGGTALLVTAVSGRHPKDLPFLPLTVEYREANAAAGKIPGGYFKREGRLSEKEILTCRLIDRPIRPLFPKSYRCDTQIIGSLHSYDKTNEPDVLGITASAGLMLLLLEVLLIRARARARDRVRSRARTRSRARARVNPDPNHRERGPHARAARGAPDQAQLLP